MSWEDSPDDARYPAAGATTSASAQTQRDVDTLPLEKIRVHMRRTAREDAEPGGQQIRAGDTVVMWYVSGKRDEEVIDHPEGFVIDRPRPRHHLSFGSGVHRCVGDPLAGLHLVCIMYVGFKRFAPEQSVGFDLSTEYAAALALHEQQRGRNGDA